MHRFHRLVLIALCSAVCQSFAGGGKAAHVVVMVWDGMRPDFIGPQTTPTLYRLMRKGVMFANHHPVYVSSTEVNCTALATGVYPGMSGIIGNEEFRPAINPLGRIMTASIAEVSRGDAVMDDRFLAYPTVAEILRSHRLGAVIAGAKPVTLLQDRHAEDAGPADIDLFEGHVLPVRLERMLRESLPPFPPVTLPKRARDAWTTSALLSPLWSKGVPAFSLLWLSEPDYSQHNRGPGSSTALDAIKSCDENLARVLAELERRQLREQTDVIVVSDHGFSTILKNIDMATVLNQNGFRAAREFPPPGPTPGEVMVVGNGGTVFLYVRGHPRSEIENIVHFLQRQPFCGVVLTRKPVEGAFLLKAARIDSPAAPDIVVSLRWTDERSQSGTPGLVYSDYGQYGPGQGIHASLSRFDLHNTCVAAGPDFRQGFRDDLPTGNIDIAPTVLWILGVKAPHKLSGRVLAESLASTTKWHGTVRRQHLEATYKGKNFAWHQYLDTAQLQGVTYFLEGNGGNEPLQRSEDGN